MLQSYYLCVDLKSFYASVECVERGLNPLTTNLVVADESRTEKTICLAATPSLKAYGISGRARLFEVIQKVNGINTNRRINAPGRLLEGKSFNAIELQNNPSLELSYIVAPPRMGLYVEYSSKRIYDIYLKYIAPEDMHIYSIDEVFIDITHYLSLYKLTPYELAQKIIKHILKETGITATAGIGTNLYLAKIAMDIMAKKMPADKDGVRIAELDEMSYRRELWSHTPLTDFWRVGNGYAKKLEANRLYTMGDIARFSKIPYGEEKLYKLFGINAELLIDHAWGYEPCTMRMIKEYKPESKSISTGQVLHCAYIFEDARLVVREMLELLSYDLIEKRIVTDQIVLTIGYDRESLSNEAVRQNYKGEITNDYYGRKVPKHAHGTTNIGRFTSSAILIIKAAMELYDEIVDKMLLVRRITITANHIISEKEIPKENVPEQLDIFTDYEKKAKDEKAEEGLLKKERALQETTLDLKRRFGKNAILKGSNLYEEATAKQRNEQIGGHRA